MSLNGLVSVYLLGTVVLDLKKLFLNHWVFSMLLGFMIQLNACLTIRRLWGRGVKLQDLLVNKFSKILAKCVLDVLKLTFWIFFQILIFPAVLSPKDSESANSVAQALKPYNLPIAAFSSSSAQALLDQGVTGFISTAPFLFDYVQTMVELLKLIGNSNLVNFWNFFKKISISGINSWQQRGFFNYR